MPNQPAGVFWAVLSRLLIVFQVIILILSKCDWPAKLFDRFFPVLGPAFGLGALGIFQCLIGATILSHHANDFTLVSGFFLFSLCCLNMLLGLILRESAKVKRSISESSWRSEAKGILPKSTDSRPAFTGAAASFVSSVFSGNEKADDFDTWKCGGSKAGYGFGRQGEKAAGLRGFISKPVESLPRYATKPSSTSTNTDIPVFKSSRTAL